MAECMWVSVSVACMCVCLCVDESVEVSDKVVEECRNA